MSVKLFPRVLFVFEYYDTEKGGWYPLYKTLENGVKVRVMADNQVEAREIEKVMREKLDYEGGPYGHRRRAVRFVKYHRETIKVLEKRIGKWYGGQY